ncbi:hypothetical protein MRS76_00360 [Rhizobiaceae bacterium n13]|uniref:RpiR family transcriptional regulator n=1 Tax=Ferirhizobium litorale TaxID=2927786 RepID=A0AAE3QAS0_9HYPH|nr:hypothetical protein [Fererhizobium litorale]MDI7860393.1 hypothetical protein [Fererhizobium litorale]MDI7920528.1 hypothetical protein [Fererhizobium litorale]
MTVGRFLRSLGFQRPEAVRESVRDIPPHQNGAKSAPPVVAGQEAASGGPLADTMARHIETLQTIHRMSGEYRWREAVGLICDAEMVFVAAFHDCCGIARGFSDQLLSARGAVHYLDGQDGTYQQLLTREADNLLLIVIDCHRLSTKSRTLARAAKAMGHRVLFISDQDRGWTQENADVSLPVPPAPPALANSPVALAALLDFLMISVLDADGERARNRAQQIVNLQDLFGEFTHGGR